MTGRVTQEKLARALKQGSQAPPNQARTRRVLQWAQLVGAIGAIGYGASGVALGLAQQRAGLPPDEIDCAYRAELLRARVLALTQRSAKESLDDPQDDVVSTLIRETQAACTAKDAESARRLDETARLLHEHLERRQQEAEARRALLAL